MDDEDIFRRAMTSLGVKPLNGRKRGRDLPAAPADGEPADGEPADGKPADGKPADGEPGGREPGGRKPPPRRRRPEPGKPDEEDALFLATMKELGRPSDKDAPAAAPRRRETRRLKASESRGARPGSTLDLHGSSTEQALLELERFVAASAAERIKTVLVVTGKGLRSAGGVAVLKKAVERWLRSDGKRWVAAFSEAPRNLGGRGAYILYLR